MHWILRAAQALLERPGAAEEGPIEFEGGCTKCSSLRIRLCECFGVSSLVHSAASSRLRITTAGDPKVLITPAAAPGIQLL